MADGKWVMTEDDARRVDLSHEEKSITDLRKLPNYGQHRAVDDRRGDAELEVGVETQFAKHTHGESRVPAVLVAGDERLVGRSVLGSDGLRADILQFDVLQVCAHEHSEVEWAQVGVGAVLHLAALRRNACCCY